VDRSVTRIIATLLRFDNVLSQPAPDRATLGAPGHRALAREVAARSVVLLRNEPVDGAPVLPMTSDARVAVVGRLANVVNLGDGGSSDVWDLECLTVLDGLRSAGMPCVHDDGEDLDRAAAAAASCDVAVVVVGYTYLDEGEYIGETDPSLRTLFPPGDEADVLERFEARLANLPETVHPERLTRRPAGFAVGGDRSSLRLADGDVALIERVAAANPRTVVVLQAGSAVLCSEWADRPAAIVQSWYGGCQAGPGLTDVLLGVTNPSARMPFSVVADESHLPPFDRDASSAVYDQWHGWWLLRRQRTGAKYPFGFGLSYTTFVLTEVAVTNRNTTLEVTCTVANTGKRDGADVVQVYAAPADGSGRGRLVGFARVEVPAGGSVNLRIDVPLDRLSRRDPTTRSWLSPSGSYELRVGRHAEDTNNVLLVSLPG
jgi:beta-glucosidase